MEHDVNGLRDSAVDRMRRVAERYLPERCDIQRPSVANDGAGGRTELWVTVYSNVPCRLVASSTRVQTEVTIGGRLASSVPWTITMPAETGLLSSDRIRIGSRVFAVEIVVDRSYEIVRRVECTEVT